MDNKLEVLGQHVSEYLEVIKHQLVEKFKAQNNNIISTVRGDFEVIKIEQCFIDTLDIDNGKLHHLFSQDGCKISGKILMRALTYVPHSDKNLSTLYNFEIVFKSTPIKFNFDDETFTISENINIVYITLSDRRF